MYSIGYGVEVVPFAIHRALFPAYKMPWGVEVQGAAAQGSVSQNCLLGHIQWWGVRVGVLYLHKGYVISGCKVEQLVDCF
jgi:hypothetical protein